MSLKAFHIFFIALSTLCAFGFSVWLFLSNGVEGSSGSIFGGIASAAVGVSLILYGIRFLRKFKNLSFM